MDNVLRGIALRNTKHSDGVRYMRASTAAHATGYILGMYMMARFKSSVCYDGDLLCTAIPSFIVYKSISTIPYPENKSAM